MSPQFVNNFKIKVVVLLVVPFKINCRMIDMISITSHGWLHQFV